MIAISLLGFGISMASPAATASYQRMFEYTFESRKAYADPFNDVEVDVIFSRRGRTWRVPAFWRGGQRWTVRFAPPIAGEFSYRLEASDQENDDLNGERGIFSIDAYAGTNALLRHGTLQVSANRRYLEHVDGTPFFWLGDTWWTGLSDRLDWSGFQTLVADRKHKSFTVVQIFAGLVPLEENPPADPGFVNEGGQVWEDGFARINPAYFDYADRRLLHLIDQGLLPAIAGAWGTHLPILGIERMKKHWRYVIGRYGAFPVVWIAGGEVLDQAPQRGSPITPEKGGWTEIARYIKATDAHQNLLTVHERGATGDGALLDRTITDFDLPQASHLGGWRSIPVNIMQIGMHYARNPLVKPVIQGEIGYEKLGEQFFEDFQRIAFWTTMLNGGAGHTYGANGVFESYTADKPFHRIKWSFLTWQEGMQLPGAYQVGLAAKLLQEYRWWKMAPRPEWISPGGTTFFEPRSAIPTEDITTVRHLLNSGLSPNEIADRFESEYPGGKWQEKNGTYSYPYIAGIPGELRIAYLPYFGLVRRSAPTIHQLEPGVRYQAYYWEPTTGTRIDLGEVENPKEGEQIFSGTPSALDARHWEPIGKDLNLPDESGLVAGLLLNGFREENVVLTAGIAAQSSGGVFLRYIDPENFLAALYSAQDSSIYLIEQTGGQFGEKMGHTPVSVGGKGVRLRAEVRGSVAAVALDSGTQTYSSEIVNVDVAGPAKAGLISAGRKDITGMRLEVHRGPELSASPVQRRLIDAEGRNRGELKGSDESDVRRLITWLDAKPWDEYARTTTVLLDSYRPEEMPTSGDWVLILETPQANVNPRVEE
jgi:hypothetical protein